ncbi:beta-1,4-galactosyltransferase 1 [Elysia marginata]|uniref:Beta-1,4-galactosyltransferase 1 n=1 Tax=Elysia marginata TaxID=1093978 RepID=A0AAV4EXV6_9GAST|nr:beta-1,4-galactosyltransferase 1 [Elysia marginata]
MVRHTKATRSESGNELFLGWRERWRHDGLNDPAGMNYTVQSVKEFPLYTSIVVSIGSPPPSMDVYMTDRSKDVSLWW